MQHQPRFLQPLPQLGDRRGVVIVEVRPGGEQLDGLEPVAGDLGQVLPAQPLVVVEVRRNPELHVYEWVQQKAANHSL